MLFQYFQLLFFMHLLLELLVFHMLHSHISLLYTWRVYLLNKLIGVWLETENAKCGRWYNEKIYMILWIVILYVVVLGNCFELSSRSCLSFYIM